MNESTSKPVMLPHKFNFQHSYLIITVYPLETKHRLSSQVDNASASDYKRDMNVDSNPPKERRLYNIENLASVPFGAWYNGNSAKAG